MENKKHFRKLDLHVSARKDSYFYEGKSVWEDEETGRWYTFVEVCKGKYKSGKNAGRYCTNPFYNRRWDGGEDKWCCHQHSSQRALMINPQDLED